MEAKKSSKKLEAEARGYRDGFNVESPSAFYSHYYTRSYNKGYRTGMKDYRRKHDR